MVEEDMKKRGVVQQDAGDREGWRRRAVKGLANPCYWGKIRQYNTVINKSLRPLCNFSIFKLKTTLEQKVSETTTLFYLQIRI